MSNSEPEQSTRRGETLEPRTRKSTSMSIWSVFGGAALVVMAAAVLVNLPDIKRYIKISRM
jgi:hypothetical protein